MNIDFVGQNPMTPKFHLVKERLQKVNENKNYFSWVNICYQLGFNSSFEDCHLTFFIKFQ
jgi:hypothetical protein